MLLNLDGGGCLVFKPQFLQLRSRVAPNINLYGMGECWGGCWGRRFTGARAWGSGPPPLLKSRTSCTYRSGRGGLVADVVVTQRLVRYGHGIWTGLGRWRMKRLDGFKEQFDGGVVLGGSTRRSAVGVGQQQHAQQQKPQLRNGVFPKHTVK